MKNAVGNLDLNYANPIQISFLRGNWKQNQQNSYVPDSAVVKKLAKALVSE
jgi:hypothetical protein